MIFRKHLIQLSYLFPEEVFQCWHQLKNLAYFTQLVHRLSKLSTRGTVYFTLVCSWPKCVARIYFVTCFVFTGHGPLLRQLQSLSIGATVNNMYAGAFLHADDICTLASSLLALEAHVAALKKFTEEEFLKLNTAKC